MSISITEGSLVKSKFFDGVGKVIYIEDTYAKVSFFESPLYPQSREVKVELKNLYIFNLPLESTVFFKCKDTSLWRRGRYGGNLPEGLHLIIANSKERYRLELDDLNVLNNAAKSYFYPNEFIATKTNDSPFLYELREKFVKSYIKQRAACKSISSIPSSRVELEPHQLAVISRVLQDDTQKYLLADEVGLGKTIEACILVREHILNQKHEAKVLITVPESLIEQWEYELANRFLLSDELLNSKNTKVLEVCSHKWLEHKLKVSSPFTMIVIDEAHQLSPLAWSSEYSERAMFSSLARECSNANSVLLLSGTPLNGNERNFLAMLHCLNPEAYSLDERGIAKFELRVRDRERLGGIFSALTTSNSNGALESLLDELQPLYPHDSQLLCLIEKVRPHVDLFASSSESERSACIRNLRKYIGENYRLHQRMLRNRRENKGLENLFPGLAGLQCINFSSNKYEVSLDAIFDHYRLLAESTPRNFVCLNEDNFLEWVDALLESPLILSRKIKSYLGKYQNRLSQEELEILQQLLEQATEEQSDKDKVLVEILDEWLKCHSEGKVVVFCKDVSVASHIQFKLEMMLDYIVERHDPETIPRFCKEPDVRILVCDKNGQDGLNLHGGNRLAIHYSLTRNITEIEQRLGRLNRYSANQRSVKPVESIALISDDSGVSKLWLEILDRDIRVFNETVASLQYVLESFIGNIWDSYFKEGETSLIQAGEKLRGQNGLLAIERQKVRAQEELFSLDEDVQKAALFADELYEVDCEIEDNPNDMIGWIHRGFQFGMMPDVDNAFVFQFVTESVGNKPTLVDVNTILKNCVTGFDYSSGYPPETLPMSVKRHEAASSNHNILPLRYGQPFIETIWDLTLADPRGATCAFLRVVDDEEYVIPQVYFKFSWLVSPCLPNDKRVELIRADSIYSPHIISAWFSSDGSMMETSEIELLELSYSKKGSNCEGLKVKNYRDFNLKPKVWRSIKVLHWFDDREWSELVTTVYQIARRRIRDNCQQDAGIALTFQELTAKAIVLCHPQAFEN
tara:strand:- start:968 stop:4057 length:3090 start_codon:yes stop_codon:yes gene_type:complete